MTALIVAAVLAAAGPATPVGLGMREYRFSLYRPSVHAGTIAFNIKPGGGHLRFTVHLLRAGTYRLVCLKPGHAAKGMKATLRVTRHT